VVNPEEAAAIEAEAFESRVSPDPGISLLVSGNFWPVNPEV